ncbi:MAG: hypothetical protein ACR2J7_00155 [Luteimonas sp.]
MPTIQKSALCAALVFALSACNEGAEDAREAAAVPAEASQAAIADPVAAPAVAPAGAAATEVPADAVSVGTTLAGDGVVKAERAEFTTSDTVYSSASVSGKPGAVISVYWTYQDGNTHKEETAELASGGRQTTRFAFSKADGMVPGKYNVQIDVDMVPVGIADFAVK